MRLGLLRCPPRSLGDSNGFIHAVRTDEPLGQDTCGRDPTGSRRGLFLGEDPGVQPDGFGGFAIVFGEPR